MVVIGIDFSINHPGVCISYDYKKFEWLGVNNTKCTKKKSAFLVDLQQQYENVTFFDLGEKFVKGENYSSTERMKVINMVELSNLICTWIEAKTQGQGPIIVAFEGFSYGSSGNSLVDIAQGTGIMKKDILDRILKRNSNGLYIFSPGELKNAIGCKGNAGKDVIFNQFCQDPKLEIIKETGLHKLVIDNASDIFIKGKVEAPFIDMIDSYLPVLKIHSLLS